MENILSIINNYLNEVNKKYSKIIEAVDFTPDIRLIFDKIPEEKGKGYAQKKNIGGDTVFWNGKAWLPSDVYNGSLKLSEDKLDLKVFDKQEEEILNKAINSITGNLDIKAVIKAFEDSQQDFYKLKEDNKDTKEIEKQIYQAMKSMQEKAKNALDSREKALKDISKNFGNDTAKKIKKVILRSVSPKDIQDSLRRSIMIERAKEEERIEKSYTPELDASKKEFNKKDRQFMIGLIKNNYKSGLDALTKKMIKYFNEDLINEVILASRLYGGMEGLMEYFVKYDSKRKNLMRNKPKMDPSKDYEQLTVEVQKILPYLSTIRKENTTKYYDSVFEDLYESLKLLQKYQRSNTKNPKLEEEFLNLFGSDGNLLSKMKKTNLPFSDNLVSLQEEMRDLFTPTETETKLEDYLNKEKDESGKIKKEISEDDSSLLSDIKKLINKSSPDLSDVDKELIDKYKVLTKEKLKKVQDFGLSPEEIKERNKNLRDYNKNQKELKEYLKLSPEERKEFDSKQKSQNTWKDLKEKIKKDYDDFWSKMDEAQRNKWLEENKLTEDYAKWLNEYGESIKKKEDKPKKETKPKEKKKKDEIDVEKIKQLQEKLKNKKSSYIIENIEKIAEKSPDSLVRSELESILRLFKTYI